MCECARNSSCSQVFVGQCLHCQNLSTKRKNNWKNNLERQESWQIRLSFLNWMSRMRPYTRARSAKLPLFNLRECCLCSLKFLILHYRISSKAFSPSIGGSFTKNQPGVATNGHQCITISESPESRLWSPQQSSSTMHQFLPRNLWDAWAKSLKYEPSTHRL